MEKHSAFVFDKTTTKNQVCNMQFDEAEDQLKLFSVNEQERAAKIGKPLNSAAVYMGMVPDSENPILRMQPNALIPRQDQLWEHFDGEIKRQMFADDGEVIFNDLMPLAKSVSVGKIVSTYAIAAHSAVAQSSINGRLAQVVDRPSYTYDDTLVPIHDSAFGADWREMMEMQNSGWGDFADRQAHAVREAKMRTINYFLNGDSSLSFKGVTGKALKTGSNTIQVDADVDFTSAASTFAVLEKALLDRCKTLRVANLVRERLTLYISYEIQYNLLRRTDNKSDSRTFLEVLSALPDILAIKPTTALTGNQMLFVALSRDWVQPVVGMAMTTTMIERPAYTSPVNGMVWTAAGLQVKTDSAGKKGVLYWRPA